MATKKQKARAAATAAANPLSEQPDKATKAKSGKVKKTSRGK